MSTPLGMQQPLIGTRSGITMSHSRKQSMITCGQKYKLSYIDRLETDARSANLGFGGAIHSAIAAYLTAQAFGATIDPKEVFDREWGEFTSGNVSYSSVWDEDKLTATGHRSLEVFMDDWATRGWTPVMDTNGLPVIERQLEVKLHNGVKYLVIIDAVVRDQQGKVIVLDFKTPAAASPLGFSGLSDQLMGAQVATEAHKDVLGIDKVDGLVFYEILKKAMPKTSRGEGPKVHVETPSLPRSQDDINDWINELGFIVSDIQQKRFAKRPMDSFCTPCTLCDYQLYCANEKSMVGLRKKPDRNQSYETNDPLQIKLVK